MSNKKEKQKKYEIWGVPIGLSNLSLQELRELALRRPPTKKDKKPSSPGRVGPERKDDIYSW